MSFATVEHWALSARTLSRKLFMKKFLRSGLKNIFNLNTGSKKPIPEFIVNVESMDIFSFGLV